MNTFRTVPALLATALLTLATPAEALADPDTSPFSDRAVTKLNNGSLDKINTASCGIKVVNKVGTKWHRYVFKAYHVGNQLSPGGGVACTGGNCIKHWTSNSSSGPWQKLPNMASLGNASDAGYGVHCNTVTTGDTSAYTWQFFGGPFSSPMSIPLTQSSSASHVASTYASSPSTWMGICRVVVLGGTYLGTLRYETNNSFLAWNGSEKRFVTVSTPMQQQQLRQVCSVRMPDGNLERFHNFQALFGNIGESKWKTPPSSGNPPTNAFIAGKLDTGNVYACVARRSYKLGSVTVGTKRAVGWWQPGDDACHTPQLTGNNLGSAQAGPISFSILAN